MKTKIFKYYRASVLIFLLLLMGASYSSAQTEVFKLTASDADAGDNFGHSVSISGDLISVDSYYDDNEKGSAYIFRFDGNTWIEEAKLTASDGSAGDRFGTYASIEDDTLVAGAPLDDNGIGSAYVFRFDGFSWDGEAKLTASDGSAGDHLGNPVAISRDVIVASADLDDNAAGSAYVFRFDGTDWNEEAKLTASDRAAHDYFGNCVVSGDIIVCGAYRDDDKGYDSGSAYVYRFDGLNWVEEAKLSASDGSANVHFGHPIAISEDENTIIIGANRDNNYTGAAYIFLFDGTSWVEQAKLTASDGKPGDFFGHSIDIDGNIIVIGSPYGNSQTGSAYVFEYSGTNWDERAKLIASDGKAEDYFYRVGISGDTIVVGAAGDDDAGERSGAAYVFSLYIEIEIDIKPGSYPNSINLKSKEKVPVAILTTDDFDAYDVDPAACYFAGAYPLRWKMKDVDCDGDYDILFHFMTQELDLTKESTEATMECETWEGLQIIGTDSVNIVPKAKVKEKKAKNKTPKKEKST